MTTGGLTLTTPGCHVGRKTKIDDTHRETFRRLNAVRSEALQPAREARRSAAQRRELIQGLINDGVSQAESAREMGVTRQAVQKMLAVGPLKWALSATD